jgi:transposase
MLNIKDHHAILRARRQGLSIRGIARRLHYCRETITNVLNDPIPKRYTRNKCTRASVLDRHRQAIVERIHRATDDLGVCSTKVSEIFRFLRDSHGYKGCENQVREYIRAHNLLSKRVNTTVTGRKSNCRRNISLDVLKALCLTSTGAARSILEDIAQLDIGDMSDSRIENLQTRIKAEYLLGHATKKGVRDKTHVSFPLFFRFLFRNEVPSELQEMFTRKELPSLKKLLLSKSIKQRKQAATIVLCKKGLSYRAVAYILGSNKNTVSEYLRDYGEHGLDGVAVPLIRPRKADDVGLREALFALLHSPPSSHGINRTSWMLKDLKRVLKLQGRSVCTHVIRQIIRSAGYKWRKARMVLTSNDPEYRQKLDRIKSILSTLGQNERFFSIDEWGPFAVTMKGGKRLVPPGEYPSVPKFQKSKGCLIMTAALELSTNQVIHFYSKKKDTGEMIKLLDILLKKYKRCKKLYLSWDAGSWHASKVLCDTVDKVNRTAYRRKHHTARVELAPLPALAQSLNVIESVFSGMSRAIIHNSNYGSVEEVMSAIDRYLDERNKYFQAHPKRAGNKIWGKELVPCTFSETQNCKDPRW